MQAFPTYEFDVTGFRHREIAYDPAAMRAHRPRVFILTDNPASFTPASQAAVDGVVGDLRDLSDRQVGEAAFYVFFNAADDALAPIRRIVACGGLFLPPPMFHKAPYWLVGARVRDTLAEVTQRLGHEPFGGTELHAQICQGVEMTRHVAGDFVEIGVFSGSSALSALVHARNLGLSRRC